MLIAEAFLHPTEIRLQLSSEIFNKYHVTVSKIFSQVTIIILVFYCFTLKVKELSSQTLLPIIKLRHFQFLFIIMCIYSFFMLLISSVIPCLSLNILKVKGSVKRIRKRIVMKKKTRNIIFYEVL